MRNTFGNFITLTLAGESHGGALVAVIDGLPAGLAVDTGYIAKKLALRRPSGQISTSRRETDDFRIVSGLYEGRTCGTPLTFVIPNSDTRSSDYAALAGIPRPSHADYTAHVKYGGFEDPRGGGHFSGRVTAGIVAAGAVAEYALAEKGVKIATHILSAGGVSDRSFGEFPSAGDMDRVAGLSFPVADPDAGEKMKDAIAAAKESGDSVGGILETAVTGLPAGLGEPWFDSCESMIAHAVFSVPAVKGIEFGAGFSAASMKGSEANDPFRYENGRVVTTSNRSGGIAGGITNGMPLIFRCAVKPTPSIALPQQSVDLMRGENTGITVGGRHDPCIVHRAAHAVTASCALALLDLYAGFCATKPAER